ncbi:hypothetical protein QLQ12_35400 [Actinoplanes sp. NEAU-A12]|uniref:Uncharacterized protein n=1 Tax=Actinoplanes sandaracinus TaxID=3045177 RepID=A0ABT6WW16_9ACTN|nr:hypothetical protein [Actinoplanes sandaracinus]MDI6103915.1 hypothetical protein [Actinoplanes sandaracinus]
MAGVFWSVRHDPPTVPEQRDIGQALSGLRAASGAVVAAAQAERWVLRLGELRVDDCAITPVRDGQEATRDVTLYVPEGDARAALDAIADGLPADYRAGVLASRGATLLSLFADAGEHVGVEAEAHAADQVLTVQIFTGCRPSGSELDRADPAVGAVPALLDATVAGIGAGGGTGVPASRAVVCPGGGTLSTFEADAGPAGPESGPRGVPDGTEPVWVEAGGWAYRAGSESVVVTSVGERLRVSVTTGCRAG